MSILDAQVSVFNGSFDTAVIETVPLRTILDRIQHGTYKAHVERLRHILATQGEQAYKAAKEKSVAYTPSCAMTTRDAKTPWPEKLMTCTNLVHLDLDKLDDPEGLK